MKKILILGLFLIGCSERINDIRSFTRDAGRPDAPQSCIDFCPINLADRCINDQCVCGPSGNICEENQECRNGNCLTSDLLGHPCEFDDVCPDGFLCVVGRCTRAVCLPERCDGIDNDCNGEIDDVNGMPLSRWCWDDNTAASSEIHTPPCSIGVQVCDRGDWGNCRGAVSPIDEVGTLACNGADENCDGCIDGNLVGDTCEDIVVSGFDIIFALDTSGSMETKIEAVRRAVNSFSSLYSSDIRFRFGIVLVPGETDSENELFLDLTNFATFNHVLSTTAFALPTGAEPTIDFILEIGNGTLPISWRENSIRIVILFTDEAAQTYYDPPNTMENACSSLVHGESLFVFTERLYFTHFDDCATVFELTNNDSLLTSNLTTIIRDPCE